MDMPMNVDMLMNVLFGPPLWNRLRTLMVCVNICYTN